jgi:hypothetical protein
MVDIQAFPYLCFVRFDLPTKEFDREFNIHFDDHIQELANRPGLFNRLAHEGDAPRGQ